MPPVLIAGLLAVSLMVLAVLIHYLAASRADDFLDRTWLKPRQRMLVVVFVLLFAHLVEISLFGAVVHLLLSHFPSLGSITGSGSFGHLDALYLSATTYTTLGYGDLTPIGPIRFVFAMEALTGFVLITWSASLTFIEIQHHWQDNRRRRRGET